MNPEFTEDQPTSNEGGLAFPSSGIVDLGERVQAFLDETKKTVEQPASQARDEVPSGDQIVADMKTFIADNFDELSRSDEPSITAAAITDDFQQKGSELLTEAEQKVGQAVDSAAEKLDQMRKIIEPEKEAIEEADRIIEQADQKLEEVVRDVMHRAEDAVEHISGRLQDKEDAGMDTVEDENKRVEQAVEVIKEEMAKEAEAVREITEELAEKLNQVRDEAQSVLKEVEELNSQPEETAERKIEPVVESMQDSIPTDPLPTETAEQVQSVAEEALAQIQDPESKRLIDLVNEDTEATIQKFAQGESQNLNEALFERKNSDDEDSFTKIEKEIEEKMKVHEATPAVVDNKPSEQAAEGPNEITHNIEVFEGEDPNKFEERRNETAEFTFDASIGSTVEKLPEEMEQQQFIPPTESMIETKNEAKEAIAQVINASALESAVGDAQQEAVNDDMQQQMQKPAGERIDSFEINENRGGKELKEDIQQNPPAEDRQNPPENIDKPPEMPLDDENLDSVAELSEYSKLKFVEGREGVEPKRAESFGSIDSIETRQQFKTAIHNLKEGLPFGEETQQVHTDREKTPQKERAAMDSPNADLSPNAPFQKGFDELTQQHVNPSDNSVPPAPGQTSAEGSLDSSGFEKVDHDILDQYSQEFKNQLDQATFGRLPDDPDNRTVTGPDSGTEEDVGSSFVIVQKPEEMTDKDKVQLSYAGDGLDVVIPVPVLRKEVKPVEQQKQVGFEFI
ncbi:hypothetical protein WR25_18021 [Diploscapter pachys]|uniref:Uncharacterized protein n=1 Tax=Diploscapter pachys TaxID=2018661 RepID=A0A2A2KN11_9BILA|nr:hypothetical protein WR25_18021 [Diploscapter pachys]